MASNTKHVFHHALKPRYAISNGALPRKAHAIVFRAAPSVRTEESAVSFTYPRKQPPFECAHGWPEVGAGWRGSRGSDPHTLSVQGKAWPPAAERASCTAVRRKLFTMAI